MAFFGRSFKQVECGMKILLGAPSVVIHISYIELPFDVPLFCSLREEFEGFFVIFGISVTWNAPIAIHNAYCILRIGNSFACSLTQKRFSLFIILGNSRARRT